MFTFTETKTTEYPYTLDDVKKNTTNFHRSHNGRAPVRKPKRYDHCMSLLSDLIRKYRYEILGTYANFKIITNGYGEFKHIEAPEKDNIKADTVFNRIEILLK